ncbi:MAG: type II secretion system F family protein [Candidatus Babeliales bacterium]
MALYQYDAFNRRGGRVSGTIDATSLQNAKELLKGQGLMPVKISEISSDMSGQFTFKSLFERPIELKTIILFTKQLAVLLRSAVPLLQALELLTEQFDGKFKRILISTKDGIKSGEPFSKELGKYPTVFSNVYIQLVKAGEASGKLDPILERLSDYLEKAEATKKRIKKAMAYPIMMLSFAGVVVVGMLTGLVPKFKGMFDQMGQSLPLPTQILMVTSDFLMGHYFLILTFMIGGGILFSYWKSTASGKYTIDELLLRFPLTSYFSRTKAVVQFSKTLGMLLESGVNLSEALDIVCNIVDNKVLTQKLLNARDKIIKEGKIATYLRETGIFPSIASYMISTGEQSGKLAEMLMTVGNDYDNELTELTDSLTSKIAPIMTLVMGVVIVFIVLSIFLPIMSLGDLAGI